jgi:hypothetical protein
VDNGSGMDRKTLIQAMRPGTSDPRAVRSPGDLGRFGLGLKTASFSQCRKLTVVTRTGGVTHAARWDLDLVASKRAWTLQLLGSEEIATTPRLSMLGDRGTLVLWEDLDRIVQRQGGRDLSSVLNEVMTDCRRHLELVFHRFLSGESGLPKIRISINGTDIDRLNPFAEGIPGRRELAEQRFHIDGSLVRVRPFVLPFPTKLNPEQFQQLELGVGFLRSQGFYVYRCGRLVIHGTWFRLLKQSEATKLVRVQVDVPNTLDSAWTIDVRKSRADPPVAVRDWLKVAVANMGEASRKVIKYRGRVANDDQICHLWNRIEDRGDIRYQVNVEHPMIAAVTGQLSAEVAADFVVALRALEQSVPMTAIYADMASRPVDKCQQASPEIAAMLAVLVRTMRSSGRTDAEIRSIASSIEPFCNHMPEVDEMLSEVMA